MLNYEDEGYEEAHTKEVIDYLLQFLNKHYNKKHPKLYTVIEYFPLKKKLPYEAKIYELYNIAMEIENGIVVSSDADEKIYEDKTRVLIGFCVDSIIYIGFQGGDHITISFSDGYIQIYY